MNRDPLLDPLIAIQVVIPVRDEELTIAPVIRQLRRQGLSRIRVVDNGSTTAARPSPGVWGSRCRRAEAGI